MTRTPPTLSLIGITLTVLALATGSWLSDVNPFQPDRDWTPDAIVDVLVEPDGGPDIASTSPIIC